MGVHEVGVHPIRPSFRRQTALAGVLFLALAIGLVLILYMDPPEDLPGRLVVWHGRPYFRARSRREAVEADGDLDEATTEVMRCEILPRWIGWPIWAVVTVASLVLIYALIFYGLPSWFARS